MSDVALLWVTFASRAEAERVAETVLAERLAACANILNGCTSIYRWQGEVHRGEEVPALFKTTPMLARRLRDRIAALHGYELPVIETWPAAAGDAVYAWVSAETGA
ncbi:divalent-cation tolerance protein CutA [Sphingomonas canadensis]|uniref:Divalent-cation tolerance protein CutA n=1 Tax=Sphingomonas canadensis TaxID=1219257 RepID=A0ABW3H805_9SPHN|nr:divalent-cation tolerance protein CutA [Sphingomonas canadensis]MCW3837038.1 divalent-cation tolerance protein CutA [Sphingomonas canadensis]